ncbi:hypothetical protein [Sphaerothrix gracilis]|uniref:hypothetical protein n=1 Tax=Sphaerothrix gracilis TaxID=3151835 RepID=UPI0031FDED81
MAQQAKRTKNTYYGDLSATTAVRQTFFKDVEEGILTAAGYTKVLGENKTVVARKQLDIARVGGIPFEIKYDQPGALPDGQFVIMVMPGKADTFASTVSGGNYRQRKITLVRPRVRTVETI